MGRGRTKVVTASFPEESEQGFQSRPFESPRRSSAKARTTTAKRTVIGSSIEEQEEGEEGGEYNPRAFPYNIKQACWEKAQKIKGRDPDRWRRDALGNIVFRKLAGCPGCLCHDYDHILPYSKGGKSTVDNCQVLQAAANRAKGNRTDMSTTDLVQKSAYCRVSAGSQGCLLISYNYSDRLKLVSPKSTPLQVLKTCKKEPKEGTWMLLNFQRMGMCIMSKNQEVAGYNRF